MWTSRSKSGLLYGSLHNGLGHSAAVSKACRQIEQINSTGLKCKLQQRDLTTTPLQRSQCVRPHVTGLAWPLLASDGPRLTLVCSTCHCCHNETSRSTVHQPVCDCLTSWLFQFTSGNHDPSLTMHWHARGCFIFSWPVQSWDWCL